jgi:hypothetical protein
MRRPTTDSSVAVGLYGTLTPSSPFWSTVETMDAVRVRIKCSTLSSRERIERRKWKDDAAGATIVLRLLPSRFWIPNSEFQMAQICPKDRPSTGRARSSVISKFIYHMDSIHFGYIVNK